MTIRYHLAPAVVLTLALLGCARWQQPPALPTRNSLVLDQLVVFSDAQLPEHHRLLEELRLQRSQLATKLGLGVSDEPIHVYLFSSADKLEGFMRTHHPSLPGRRAYFVESDTRLSVYAFWGDRVAEDLRHEVAHGYLHAVVPQLPLWMDEGLAEYFEVARGQRGINRPHVAFLVQQLAAGWRPNLARLEGLRDANDMSQSEYAESWAWVHFLLETTPERLALVRGYLTALAKSNSGEPLSVQLARIEPDYPAQLVAYVEGLNISLR
jgi:hypothetical protein